MLRFLFANFIIVIALSFGSHSANKQNRIALVIGNSAYLKTPVLPNPQNDAKAIAEALAGLEFEVIEGFDLSKADFDKSVLKFARKLKGADVGLFFYAGHGLQVNGRNYLVPVDAELEDEAALDFSMVQLKTVLKQMERQPRTNLIFLDACRDNPLARNLSRSMGTRGGSIGRGLAQASTGIGTMIAYATQPGNVAKDGDGNNSPFTTALLEHINTPGENISSMMQKVRNGVIKATGGDQVPWDHSSLTGPFVFKKQLRQQRRNRGGGIDVEAIYWQTIMDKENAELFRAYMKDYPQGRFMSIAGHLIKRYEPKKIATSIPRTIVRKKKPLIDEEHFLGCIRPKMFKRGMRDKQVQSLKAFIGDWDGRRKATDLRWLAYIMGTAYHETQLVPVREGFKKTDAAARKFVKFLYDRKITKLPYFRPDQTTGHVYYGRGFVQLTWGQNYKKMGIAIGMGDQLYQNPELLLDPKVAAKILTTGMIIGAFRYSKTKRPKGKQKLSLFFNSTEENWVGARTVINGDLKKNGERVAGYAKKFHGCLKLADK